MELRLYITVNMEEEFVGLTTEDYNNEPIYYCKHCLSLKVKIVGGYDFCDDCGSTAIDTAHIEEWEKLYEDRYGYKFLEEVEKDYYNYLN